MLSLSFSGHFCPMGSTNPIRCPSGYYQDELGSYECKDCPSGYYCDNTMDPVVLYNGSHCPTGMFLSNVNVVSLKY